MRLECMQLEFSMIASFRSTTTHTGRASTIGPGSRCSTPIDRHLDALGQQHELCGELPLLHLSQAPIWMLWLMLARELAASSEQVDAAM